MLHAPLARQRPKTLMGHKDTHKCSSLKNQHTACRDSPGTGCRRRSHMLPLHNGNDPDVKLPFIVHPKCPDAHCSRAKPCLVTTNTRNKANTREHATLTVITVRGVGMQHAATKAARAAAPRPLHSRLCPDCHSATRRGCRRYCDCWQRHCCLAAAAAAARRHHNCLMGLLPLRLPLQPYCWVTAVRV